MFQRRQARSHESESVPAVARVPSLEIGRRTRCGQLQVHGPANPYESAVATVQRELAALRSTALPNYIAVLRRKDVEPGAKQMDLARAAWAVQQLFITANQTICGLEKGQWFADPMVAFLRAALDALVARALKLGVYRDIEHIAPKPAPKRAKPADAGDVPAAIRAPAKSTGPAAPRAARGTPAPDVAGDPSDRDRPDRDDDATDVTSANRAAPGTPPHAPRPSWPRPPA
jgi:hypothetical protein